MKKWLLMAICVVAVAGAADHPRVDQALKDFDAHVTQLRAEFSRIPADPGDKEWIKAKLRHMAELDQYWRKLPDSISAHTFSASEQMAFNQKFYERSREIDGTNLADLKKMLVGRDWFTVSEFGAEADKNAWLLVQHADQDIEFQTKMLAVLEPLALRGETSPTTFAYLHDRIAVSLQDPANRRLQRFGTQGQCTGPGTWEHYPVEEPEKLDERRKSVGLMPQAEYQAFFKDICHESAANAGT